MNSIENLIFFHKTQLVVFFSITSIGSADVRGEDRKRLIRELGRKPSEEKVGLDLCYEKITFHISYRKNSPISIFEVQKWCFVAKFVLTYLEIKLF